MQIKETERKKKLMHYKELLIDVLFFITTIYEQEGRNSNNITATEIVAMIRTKIDQYSKARNRATGYKRDYRKNKY